jgi:hypothetical protein
MMKLVKHPNDIPNEPHYVILIFNTLTYHVEGDERSKQAPGHGYPEHTETHLEIIYRVTTSREEWEKEIQKLHARDPGRDDLAAFYVSKMAKVNNHVIVHL